jgi:hypothetical protein
LGSNSCFISFPVTDGSRVDVVGISTLGDADQSRRIAVRFAGIVAPEILGGPVTGRASSAAGVTDKLGKQ